MNSEDLGFVLAIHEYREHDAFVTFLSRNHGLIRMVLPAYYKQNSKQLALGLEFSKVKYQSKFTADKLNRIYSGKLIDLYRQFRNDWDWLLDVSLLAELIIKFHSEENHTYFYNAFEQFLTLDTRQGALIQIIWDILAFEGIQPYLDSCVKCDSTKINSFSIREGGFLCVNHTHQRSDVTVLLQLRALSLDKLNEVSLEESDQLLIDLMYYLSYHSEYQFNAWKLRSRV